MKTVSPALLSYFQSLVGNTSADFNADYGIDFNTVVGKNQSNVTVVQFDLYTISLYNGFVLTFTTADFAISAPNTSIFSAPKIFGAGELWFAGMKWVPMVLDTGNDSSQGHWKVGLDTDQWTFTISPRLIDPMTGAPSSETVGSASFLYALRSGAFDNADIVVSRAYFATMPNHPIPPTGAVPLGTVIIFRGIVGDIALTTSSATITVRDYKSLLSMQMPRNVYQASCKNQLYDNRCSLLQATYSLTGTAIATSTRVTVVASAAVSAPSGSGTFVLGRLIFTSGLNIGCSRLITAWDGLAKFALLHPFPYSVSAGDTFTVTAGCDKKQSTCALFNNQNNFRGDRFIPLPEVVLG